MKRIKDKICDLEVKALCGLRSFLKDEQGDTNFISIALILIIVIAVGTVVVGFGTDVKNKLSEKTGTFLNLFN